MYTLEPKHSAELLLLILRFTYVKERCSYGEHPRARMHPWMVSRYETRLLRYRAPYSMRNGAKIAYCHPHRCIETYQTVSKCIVTYPNVSNCIETYPNVSNCIETYPNVSNCIEVYRNISNCIVTYPNVLNCIVTY